MRFQIPQCYYTRIFYNFNSLYKRKNEVMNMDITSLNFRGSLEIYQFSCIILLGHYLQS